MSLTTRAEPTDPAPPDIALRPRRSPERTCIGCRARRAKGTLLRLAVTAGGRLALDEAGRGPGRGAYLCRRGACWRVKGLTQRLGSALRRTLTSEDQAWLAAMAARWDGEADMGASGG